MRKLQKSYKSNTRIYDDGSIEVDPQAQGEPSQKEVKKVGKSKRYVTNGKNPLTCVELKCPEDVPDKAAFFHKELAKLTKDMEIEEPQLPEGEFLLNEPSVKVKLAAKEQKVINSVMLKLSDGTDSFLGEITGERAVNCPRFDPQYQYKVQCSMVVREWNSQQTGEAMQATTIYVDKIGLK